jgi:splicing factor 3B subunit 3
VLVLCEDFLYYKSYPAKHDLKCKYPKRLGVNSKDKTLINCSALHKQKGMFFYFIQSEYGDLFKVTMAYTGKDVHSLSVQYIDTIHPANSLCILKSGYVFAAADTGNQ